METMHDMWLWAEQMNGDLVNMPGSDVFPDTDVEGRVASLFERYEQATLIRLWQQTEEKHHHLTNVCLKTWSRPPQYRREPPSPDNPLGIFCVDCGAYCHYRMQEKRWYCGYSHA